MTVQLRPDDASAAAVHRHVASMRRARRWYLIAIASVIVVLAAWVAIVWSRSEVVHAHLHTAGGAPPDVPGAQLSATPRLAWHSDERTAIGEPFEGGTVVTYSAHTVNGRDARTGTVTWSYTRTDRTICDVVQQQGHTVAFFLHGGNCDEVNAFDTGTGKRVWERTLDTESHPVIGHPTITAVNDAIFVSTTSVVYAIRVNEGYDFWEYAQPAGCQMTGLAVGSAGALIAQQCADGRHLLLRDRYAGNDDKDHPVKWRLANVAAVPFAADAFVGALDPATHELVRYDPANGKVLGRLALTPRPPAGGTVQQSAAQDAELAWIGGTTYTINATGTAMLWSARTSTVPTVTSSVPTSGAPQLASSVVLVAGPAGVDLLDARTGKVAQTLPTSSAPAAGSLAYPVGTGFVLAGASTTVYR